MKQLPRISDSEWEVMKVLWEQGPCASAQVVDSLTKSTSWKPNTIRTLIARLVAKGAIHVEKVGREHRYSAAFTEEQCTRDENRSFVKRVYNGALLPMLVGMLEQEKLTPNEIAELRKVLDRIEKK